MNIQLSDHFTVKKLIQFVLPSVIMMLFTSIYGVVDGFFVSNYAGKTEFAAVNLILPFIMLIGALGFMIGAGGNALVSKTLGEGNDKKANELFSMLIYFVIIIGVLISILGQIFLKDIALLLGADSAMLDFCVTYGRISLCTITFFMLQNIFQNFLITAEKPQLGLAVTVIAGITNMALDFLFVGIFKWGVGGASLATSISELFGGGIPLLYFIFSKNSKLKLGKAHFDGKALIKTFTNGSSELMTNASLSFVNMVYNLRLVHFFGENGIAAYGVIMYVNFMFLSIYIGYSIGVAPIIGYCYGAGNNTELKNIFKKSLNFYIVFGIILTAAALLLSQNIADLFTSYNKELNELTVFAFRLFAISYLFSGFNIFGSAFFTALNNGAISAAISFLRTLLFQISAVLALPLIFGENAIWTAMTVSEVLALSVTAFFLIKNKKKYQYI